MLISLPGTSSNANLIDFQAPGKLNVENLVNQTASSTASATAGAGMRI